MDVCNYIYAYDYMTMNECMHIFTSETGTL